MREQGFSRLLFFGNPMIDSVYDYTDVTVSFLPDFPHGAGHFPMDEIVKMEGALSGAPELLRFSGPSGGAFTAASVAALFACRVEYHGSSGDRSALFRAAAEEAGFGFFDAAGSKASSGRFISFIPDRIGPFAHPGASLHFTAEHVPRLEERDLPFFEGFLLSRLPADMPISSGFCAVDLASPRAAVLLHDSLNHISLSSRLILFGNRTESEHFFQNELEDVHDVGSSMREALRNFCGTGNSYILKMGKDGAWLFRKSDAGLRETYIPPVPSEQVHSVNAGDMFAGAFLGSIASGFPPETAAALAAAAGADAVSRPGNRLSPETVSYLRSFA